MAKRAKLDEHGGNVPEDWQCCAVWQKWHKPRQLVRGTSYREQAFLDLIGPRRPGGYCQAERVTLEREPNNEHDENAIRVLLRGQHIGYIAREVAATLATAMDEQDLLAFDVPALIVGGSSSSNRKEFGCWPWLWRAFDTKMRIGRHGAIEELKPYGTMWSWYMKWTGATPPSDEPEFWERDDEDDDDEIDLDDDELPAATVASAPGLNSNQNFLENLFGKPAVAPDPQKETDQKPPGCCLIVVLLFWVWLILAFALSK